MDMVVPKDSMFSYMQPLSPDLHLEMSAPSQEIRKGILYLYIESGYKLTLPLVLRPAKK